MTKKIWVGLAVAAALVAIPLISTEVAGSDFLFSTAPDVAIVTVSRTGGLQMGLSTLTLYGDGRLERRPGHRGAAVDEALLSYTELDELVRLLVDGGLMAWDDADVEARLEAALGHVPSYVDFPTVRIRIDLEHAEAETGEKGPATKEIAFNWSPAVVKHLAPDEAIPEAEALYSFQERVDSYLAGESG